ncbi:MAG: PEP/pyruvate-binding domain-containing protein, partial [Planctomycetota bacterium]
RYDGYELRSATQQEVDGHFAALRPKQTQTPPRDLSVRAIRSFRQLGFDDHRSVGVKAANLAVMRTFGWSDERSPDGFAVPFACYDAFMLENGFYQMAREMLAAKDFRAEADTRERALAELRKAIENGKMPKWVEDALGEVQKTFGKDESIRCRSSTNNEDLPGFSGAGLYDSFTHKPKEGHLAKTVRRVYASLWNFRAFEEREFYRVDHFAAAMGVALHRNEKKERANGVAVTKDVSGRLVATTTKGVRYYVNVQLGDDLVTNPEARSVPEELLIGPRNPRVDRVLQRSNRTGDQPLLDQDTLLELRRCLRTVHERFADLYGKQDDPSFAMEVEFKVDRKGRLLIKQARPWVE